jgi:DNA-binding MarR family transcriptional regulator/N-acetylglutamate synthase-like GNAT family acetyltransferase
MVSGTEPKIARRIEAIRRYNRFYTRKIGVLDEGLLRSPFSLTEARVIYELAHREETTATSLSDELAINPGYLSRILRTLQEKGLVERRPSEVDGRQSFLSLAEDGKKAFAKLNADSQNQIAAMLDPLSEEEQRKLVIAMETIEGLLGEEPEHEVAYILRYPVPGDMGWVVQRHGVLYAREYHYDETFEALVAEIVAKFVQHFDPKKERCWIAERQGENLGSVFLVRDSESVAKLRLLIVEPKARGLGIGKRLVQECVRFAKQCGYEKIKLWTQDELSTARHIYERAGFHVVDREPHHSFGQDLVAEVWERAL